MANVRNFSDWGGQAVELVGYLNGMRNAEFAARFPGVKGRRCDSFSMWVGFEAGSRAPLPVTRSVTIKANPSRHECDARCMNATGRTMNCECQCGGLIKGGIREWGAAMSLRDAGVLEVVRIESGVVYSYGGNGCQVTSCLLKLAKG